jgi:membrane protein DedA with SNARE-associated domain
MSVESIATTLIAYAQASTAATVAIAFALAFGESLAVISLFVPATFILVAFSGVLGAGEASFWPAWLGASIGAALGYAASYWAGLVLKDRIGLLYPFRTNPQLLARSRGFVERHGVMAAFLGHFFGPARAGVPVVAGMLAMRQIPFQAANIAASLIWAAVVLAPGQIGLPWLLGR